ncbi:MAG: lysophospholipid acyltransferase family protein, partial [Coriobacteriaceae bacterium]|nr:lysophospholipid acyltransferase family protein [Coriobacteriaceae bacterium]
MILKCEQMWDMPLGGDGGDKEVTHWFGNLCYVIFGFLCKVLWRYKVVNREALRQFAGKSGVVLVGNHSSFLDVIFGFLSVRTRQWVRFMARENLFETAKGLGGQVFSRVGAFPVARDTADRTALKRAARMLKNKEVVGIFPEGTRRGKS